MKAETTTSSFEDQIQEANWKRVTIDNNNGCNWRSIIHVNGKYVITGRDRIGNMLKLITDVVIGFQSFTLMVNT